VVAVFTVLTEEMPSLVAVLVLEVHQLEVAVAMAVVLFLAALVVEAVVELPIPTFVQMAALEEAHKVGVAEVVALLELLVHQAVLAHNQHMALALVAEVAVLQLLLLLEVVALVVLAVAVAVVVVLP
jgi:hypothetical protein